MAPRARMRRSSSSPTARHRRSVRHTSGWLCASIPIRIRAPTPSWRTWPFRRSLPVRDHGAHQHPSLQLGMRTSSSMLLLRRALRASSLPSRPPLPAAFAILGTPDKRAAFDEAAGGGGRFHDFEARWENAEFAWDSDLYRGSQDVTTLTERLWEKRERSPLLAWNGQPTALPSPAPCRRSDTPPRPSVPPWQVSSEIRSGSSRRMRRGAPHARPR